MSAGNPHTTEYTLEKPGPPDDALYNTSESNERPRAETNGTVKPYQMQPMELGGGDGLDQPLMRRSRGESAPLRYGSNKVWLSTVLIFLNVAAFFVEMTVNKWKFAPLSQNFLIGPTAEGLVKAGAQTTFCITGEHQYWRLVTAAFLHGGIIHLLVNMYALSVIAPFLERDFGAIKLFLLYIGSGCSAALATALILPDTISVGASGAICGLLGALWAELFVNCGNSHNSKTGVNQVRCNHSFPLFAKFLFLSPEQVLPAAVQHCPAVGDVFASGRQRKTFFFLSA
jgi:membrane associated rhomboid family serine protease